MKRKIYRVKEDYELDIDPDTYNAKLQSAPPPPYRMQVGGGRARANAGVYMQPNGSPIMVMPLIAGGASTFSVPVQPALYPAPTYERKK